MSGLGSLVRRGNTWTLAINVDKNETTGKYKQKWIKLKAQTKRDAEIERVKVIAEIQKKGFQEPSKMTIAEFLDRWLENCKTRISEHTGKQLNRRTVEEYGKIIKNHIQPAIGKVMVQKLTPRQVRELVEARYKKSQFTARKIYVILNSAFKQAIIDDEIDLQFNVCTKVTSPKVRKVKHPIWSAEQAVKFLEQVKCQRDYGLFLIHIHNSLRVGEALGFTWADVDLEKGTARLRQKLVKPRREPIFEERLKTEASETVIVLTPAVIQELKTSFGKAL